MGVHGNATTRSPEDWAHQLVPAPAEAQRYSQEWNDLAPSQAP